MVPQSPRRLHARAFIVAASACESARLLLNSKSTLFPDGLANSSGAVGRNAQIIFVTSKNGVFDSLQYTVNENLAPVISISYGACEQNFTAAETVLISAMGQQANAQGITIVAASGDSGAADCETSSISPATTMRRPAGIAAIASTIASRAFGLEL